MATAPRPRHTPSPLGAVRLRLASTPGRDRTARRIDGAWWPRSYDLAAELPLLLGGLTRTCEGITSVVVSAATWSALPGPVLVAGHEVHVRRTDAAGSRLSVCLLAPGRGRWDLLVVPPAATEAEADRLMVRAVERGA